MSFAKLLYPQLARNRRKYLQRYKTFPPALQRSIKVLDAFLRTTEYRQRSLHGWRAYHSGLSFSSPLFSYLLHSFDCFRCSLNYLPDLALMPSSERKSDLFSVLLMDTQLNHTRPCSRTPPTCSHKQSFVQNYSNKGLLSTNLILPKTKSKAKQSKAKQSKAKQSKAKQNKTLTHTHTQTLKVPIGR